MRLMAVLPFFSFVVLARIVMNVANYEYRYEYTSYVGEVPDQNESVSANEDVVHICRLNPEEKLSICTEALKEALNKPFVNQTDIQLVYSPQVHEEKVYEFALTGWNYINKGPIIAAACMCSTSPPIYLRDNSSGNFVDVYISFRDTYVKHIVNRENFAFRFEYIVYARPTSAPVIPFDANVRVCQMNEEEKLQMCREILAQPFPKTYGVKYQDGYGPPLLQELMYEVKMADFEYTFKPPSFFAACMCPTLPQTFIGSRYVGKYLYVYVILREEYLPSELDYY